MPDWRKFPVQFAFFAPESVAHLAGLGVQLIGIDTPSVDAFDSKTLPTHHALLKFNMRNLEGLWLQDILPGVYELCALPLRLSGADASPVRAVLRELI